MTITLPREQQEWREAQVEAGVYTTIDQAVASIVAEYMQLDIGDLSWARPLVDEGRAAIERGVVPTLEEHRTRMAEKLASFRRR